MSAGARAQDIRGAVALLVIWTGAVAYAHWDMWSIDMSALYMAGRFAALGEWTQVYNAPPDFFSKEIPDRWAAELTALGFEGEFPVPYVYPPLWALLLAPFAGATDPMTFFNITRIPMLAAYSGSIFVAWRLMQPAGVRAVYFVIVGILISSITVPFLFSASLNQPQFLVIFLILLAFERYAAGKPATAGAILGLAAALKVSPIFLVLIFLADRNWRATATCFGTAGGIAALSFLVAGPDLHWAFLDKVREVDGLVPLIGFNMNYETFMYDFFVPLQDYDISRNKLLGIDTPAVTAAGKVAMILALAAALYWTRTLPREVRLRVRVIAVYTISVWFGPLAWMHYYTLPLLLAPGLVGVWSLRHVTLMTGLLTIGFSKPLMMWLVNYSLDRGAYTLFYPQHTALFPLAFFVIALIVWSARRGQTPTGSTVPSPTLDTLSFGTAPSLPQPAPLKHQSD